MTRLSLTQAPHLKPRLTPLLMAALATLLMLTMTGRASAESKDFGEHVVHYSIFPSGFLRPDVASQYNLNRSRSLGVVNISIMEKQEDGTLAPVGGQVEGQVLNDVRQGKFLGFRRVTEGDAVYSLAQFQYRPGEMLTFQLTVRPQGSSRELPIRVTKTLFDER
ncbi:DUF4426 domain-containing protein [Marinobacter salicampi]|uniref:DUF4426 domain-containing protein n=1 Tax=Marinobacter salicampi TaxID=435907 RepID=UPI001F5EC008|nr:DUF4426 domain-containing protein [Marinobacter salicampi]